MRALLFHRDVSVTWMNSSAVYSLKRSTPDHPPNLDRRASGSLDRPFPAAKTQQVVVNARK